MASVPPGGYPAGLPGMSYSLVSGGAAVSGLSGRDVS